MRCATVVVAAIGLAACGSAAASSPVLSADPLRYVLTLNDLGSSGFTVADAPHAVDANAIAAGSEAAAQRLGGDGLQAAASVRFFRAVELSTSNGPVDVIHTVERFSQASGASASYASDVAVLDSASGATPLSAGHVGDEAHADSIVRTTTSGVPAVQITLEWRVDNVVNVLVVRGRYGGTRLDDALNLAAHVVAREH